ncbi:MAG TPA: hypothetical protein PKM21_09865 [Anaerolineales bacterium]|nr:hypothetical protein [Anaerolineales bacterium]
MKNFLYKILGWLFPAPTDEEIEEIEIGQIMALYDSLDEAGKAELLQLAKELHGRKKVDSGHGGLP